MKITILINSEKLALINRHMSYIDGVNFIGLPKDYKKIVSELIEIRKIFIKKTLNNLHNIKDFKISIAYHLADALHDFLQQILMKNFMGIFETTALESVRNDLHQQLL